MNFVGTLFGECTSTLDKQTALHRSVLLNHVPYYVPLVSVDYFRATTDHRMINSALIFART